MSYELSSDETSQLLEGQRVVLAKLAAGAPLRETLTSIAHYAEKCTPTMQASILWYEAATGRLRRGGHHRLPDSFADAVDGMVPGPSAGSCGTAAFRRARVVSTDVQVDPLWEAFRAFAANHGIRSAWSTPLLSPDDGSLLGVFGMYYPDPREPSHADLSLIDHFTHLAAIAIERNRRDEALRESERRRHHGLLALTAGLAHELNTPLGVAKTAVALALEEIANAGVSDVRETVSMAEESIARSINMVRTFQSAVLEKELHEVERVDLGELTQKVLAELTPVTYLSRLAVNLEGSEARILVRGAPARLRLVLSNLVNNVATHAYGPDGGPLTITIARSLLHDDSVELRVVDAGRGMSSLEAERCTDAFFTTARDRGGHGLGLFLVRHVVEAELNGTLLLETREQAGVRWTIVLPIAR